MTGRRREDNVRAWHSEPGDYWRQDRDGAWVWMCHCPGPNDMVGDLSKHDVIEHEDGTITVSPSILVTGGGEWHGYLEHGEWRSA